VVGDGDPHSLIWPGTVLPSTATELLEQILGRDGSPRSASTLLREQRDPAVRLAAAAARYLTGSTSPPNTSPGLSWLLISTGTPTACSTA
jgi:hypothetical protein